MLDPSLTQILSGVAIAVITGSVTFVVARINWRMKMKELQEQWAQQNARHENDIKLRLLDRDLTTLSNFISKPELGAMLSLFNGNKLDLLLDRFERANAIQGALTDQNRLLEKIYSTQFLSLNEATGRIHKNIQDNEQLFKRLVENKDSKLFIKNHFASLQRIKEVLLKENAIFIESGSTLAYAVLAIIDNLDLLRGKQNNRPLSICTNNILVYMLLLFKDGVSPFLLDGKPTNDYGATFGDRESSDTCNHAAVTKFLSAHEVTTMFTAASFLDIKYGPHVSSTANHQMKRCLNEYANDHKVKNILVVTAEKITNDVEERKIKSNCKLIFDPAGSDNVADNPALLSKAEEAWSKHIAKENNYIITGSISPSALIIVSAMGPGSEDQMLSQLSVL